jgi:Tol biopolymer transport system component
MDAYGRNLHSLTDDGKNNWRPVWSPDGTHIIYMQGYDNVTMMDEDGSNKHTIARGFSPTWSPDGQQIAYYADEFGLNADIYIVDIATQEVQNVTNNNANDWGPAWSPDGQQIAFVSSRDGNAEIYLVNVVCQGFQPTCPRETTRLTYNVANDSAPAWSSDRWLAFESQRDGLSQIYIMDASGHSLWQLTNNSADHRLPSWMP